ncbi:MAG: hypothetical protein KA521_11725, partial [Crocinitomicaceae bacterium]|nr:hypothetical protein [Crocinitomicaceae bacterium]
MNYYFQSTINRKNLLTAFFFSQTLFGAYSQTPFDYKTYSQQTYSVLAANLNDTTEAGPLNNFRRMDMFISPKIAGHNDVNVLAKIAGPITCGPNSILDKYFREIGPNRSSATNPIDNANGTGPTSFITFDPNDPNLLFTGSWASGLFYSEDYGISWKNAGTDKLENVSAAYCVSTNGTGPNKAWFLATGHGHGTGSPAERRSDGIWRTVDKGVNWQQIATEIDFNAYLAWDFQVSKIATDYNNPNILFASTSNGIYRTTNALSPSPTWQKVYNTSPTPGYFYFCSDITFKPQLGNPLGVNSNNLFATAAVWDGVTVDVNNRLIPYADIIFSTDAGSTWQSLPGTSALVAVNSYDKANVEISPADPNILFCYFWKNLGDNNAYLYKYDLTLNTYSPLVGFIESREGWDFGFAVSNLNKDYLVNGADGSTWFSDALGNPQVSTGLNSPHVDNQQYGFSPHTNDLWSSNHGGIHFFDVPSSTWVQKNDGLGTAITVDFASSNVDPGKFLVAADHEGMQKQTGLYHRSEYNEPWYFGNYSTAGGDGRTAIYDDNLDRFYGSVQIGQVWSYDPYSGGFYTNINSPPAYNKGFSNALSYDKLNAYVYDAGFTINGEIHDVYRTNSPGSSPFFKISDFVATHFSSYLGTIPWNLESRGSVIAASLVNSSTLAAHNEYFLMLNNNGNSTIASNIINGWLNVPIPWPAWSITTKSKGLWPTDIDIDDANTNHIIFSDGSISNSTVEGKIYDILVNSWSGLGSFTVKDITYNLPNVSIGSIKIFNRGSDKYYFVGTNGGLFYTTAAILAAATGPTSPVWSCYGSGAPNCYVSGIEVNECAGTLRVSYLGRGIWEVDLPDNVLTSNLTLNAGAIYTGNIIVPSGKKLTINSTAVLQMSNSSKIVVKKGAKIYVNGGTIT